MFCSKCGFSIEDNVTICPNCGAPTQSFFDQYGDKDRVQKTASDEISSVRILGILSIISGFFMPLLGWILGGIGCSKTHKWIHTEYASEARKAKILNIVGLCTATLIFLFYFSLIFSQIRSFLG